MSKKYNENQEHLIAAASQNGFDALPKPTDFTSQKVICEALAKHKEFTGVSPREILSKWLHMSKKPENLVTYHKKEYTPKTEGTTVVKKSELIGELAELVGVPDERLDSLQGATKAALLIIIGKLQSLSAFDSEESEDSE